MNLPLVSSFDYTFFFYKISRNIISPVDQCVSQIRNVGSLIDWIGFDKYKKVICGAKRKNGKLCLVAQSVFGGDKIILQQINLGDKNYKYLRFKGAVKDQMVVVVPSQTYCLLLYCLLLYCLTYCIFIFTCK